MKCVFDSTVRRLTCKYLDNLFFKILTEKIPCDYFIEIGAFEADASKNIKLKLPECKTYAFEANPYNYTHFKESLSEISYEHMAVSNITGEVTFNIQIENNGAEVSPIKMDNSLTQRVKKGLKYKQITVPCTTLNDYFSTSDLSNVGLWIDVEGHGLEVLQGATEILKHTKLLKIEVEDREYWKNQKLSDDINLFLKNLNFVPILRDFQSPKQYNVLFCSIDIFETVQESVNE